MSKLNLERFRGRVHLNMERNKEIVALRKGGEPVKSIAKKYNLKTNAIYKILQLPST